MKTTILFFTILIFSVFTTWGQTPELIFRSGFEPGTTIIPGNNPTHNIDIIGIDNSVAPPNNWVGDLEGHPNMGGTRILFQNGDATTRNAEIVQDPDPSNPGNKVMNWWIKIPNSNNERGRVQVSTYSNNNLKNISYSVRLYLSEDIGAYRTRNQQLYGFMLSEFWNNAGFGDDLDYPFSIHLSIRKVGTEPGPLVFKLSSRTKNPPGSSPAFTELWGETNRDFEMPTSKWVTLKYHFIEGNASTGRFFFSVTPDGEPETVVFDINDFTHHPDDPSPDGLKDFNPLKLYVSGSDVDYLTNSGKLLGVYWDDFELWKDKPYPNTLSINDAVFNNAISIIPNPTNSIFTIHLEGRILEKIIVYNQIGQQVKEVTTNVVDISTLPNSIYFIKVIAKNGKTAIKKIIKS